MAKQFSSRLGIAQLSVNPAYADETMSGLQEPAFTEVSDKVGLFALAEIEEVNILRQKISAQFINHLNRKLQLFAAFAAQHEVEVLILPGYSVPPDSLSTCRDLCDRYKIVIVAGTHVVTASPASGQTYRDLEISLAMVPTPGGATVKSLQVMSVVFTPGSKPLSFTAWVPPIQKPSTIGIEPSPSTLTALTKAGPLELRIMLSEDSFRQSGAGKEKFAHPRITLIPACTSAYEPFYGLASLALAEGNCTVFANVAEYGGSKVFAKVETSNQWFTESDGTRPVPKGSEALLVVEIGIERPAGTKKSKQPQAVLRDVGVFPSLYPANSSEEENYLQVIPGPDDPILETAELAKRLGVFASPTAKSFPTLLQDKVQHFLSYVVSKGISDEKVIDNWLRPIFEPDLLSTNLLRWELCNEAIGLVSTLQLSSEHIDKADVLMRVYKHLIEKRNALVPVITPKPKSVTKATIHSHLDTPTAAAESPFRDRDDAFEKIRSFMNQNLNVAFVLCGMKGIGKSSVIEAAFRQVIPPTRRIRLQITEGMPYARLLLELAHKFGLRVPGESFDISGEKLEAIQKRLLAHVSHPQATVIVLDDFQYLLGNTREIDDPAARKLIRDLLNTASNTKTKCFIVSNISPQLGPDLESKCSTFSLQGLEPTYTKGLLQYWFQFGREDLAGQVPQPSGQLVKLLAGHPLATRLAARLWSEHPSVDISGEIEIFQELRDTIVSFLLEKLTLSKSESDLMTYASIFRLPAPRAVFLRWGGNEANYVLNSLTSQYLIESSPDGYQLHPLVRDFFYQSLSTKQELAYHKIAAKFFEEQITKARVAGKPFVPEDLAEAVHHYLEAGDWVKVKSLTYYKEELKPIARSHYQRKEFLLAFRDYRVLLELDKNDVDAHFHLALIHARNDEWDEAELHFGRAIEIKGRPPWILQGFASALMRANRLAEAEQLLREAEQINRYHSPTLIDLGQLMEKRGLIIDAADYYQRAVECDPENPFGYFLLARLHYRQGEVEDAYEFAKMAMTRDPTDERNKALVQELKDKVTKQKI